MITRRRAFTLVEMLVVIGVFSVLLGIMTVSLHAMFRTGSGLSDTVSAGLQRQRFALQLRSDAHVARSARLVDAREPANAAPILLLELADGGSVEYRLHADRIDRQLRAGDSVRHVDSYAVTPVLDKGWSIEDRRPGALLTVHLQPGSTSRAETSGQRLPLPVTAALSIACGPAGTSPEPATTVGESIP